MQKVMRIDVDGFFIEDVLLEEGQALPDDCIADLVPEGLYLPKWDVFTWIEGKSQAEIDALKNAVVPKSDIELLKDENASLKTDLAQLNQTTSDFMDYIFSSIPNIA